MIFSVIRVDEVVLFFCCWRFRDFLRLVLGNFGWYFVGDVGCLMFLIFGL